MLYFHVAWCYMYSSIQGLSMQKDYQHCLDTLAAAPPQTKAALIRSLLPGIEAALNSGQRLKTVWEALRKEGLQMSYHSFHKTLSRSRTMKKPTAAASWGKQPKSSEAQALRQTAVKTVEERDPLANLKRLDPENRPGFHWRATRSLNAMVYGIEDSNDKNKR
jgi:hypothetical protein